MAVSLKAIGKAVMEFGTPNFTPEQLLRASQMMDQQHIPQDKRFIRFCYNGQVVEMPLDEAIEWAGTPRGD